MCNEEQTWILQTLSKASVVKCRHQRLAGAGRGNHEVPMTVMPITLRFQALQNLALEWPRLQVELEDLRRLRDDGRPQRDQTERRRAQDRTARSPDRPSSSRMRP